MYGFGLNEYGQLGMETDNETQYEPLEIEFKSPISKIYAYGNHSFILV